MSRLAKKPLTIPNGTTVTVEGGVVSVKGPKGTLSREFPDVVRVTVAEEGVVVENIAHTRASQALLGTTAAHLRNLMKGVTEGYEKHLILEGVGYKAAVAGSTLTMSLGFSHPVVMEIPVGIAVRVEKNDLFINGIDKETLGQFTANVRAYKEPEPYKGKGFRYHDEVIRRKQGKKTT